MKLRKKAKKKGITFETCLACGVKNTKENKQRFNKGEALDLIAEADKDIEVRSDPTNTRLSEKFIKEQEEAEKKYLDNYYKEETNEV